MSKTSEGTLPLDERPTLGSEWFDFLAKVVPLDAAPVQRQEMQRAFYAGAQAMFSLMTGQLDADHEPTLLDVAYLESLHQELQRYLRDVKEGRA